MSDGKTSVRNSRPRKNSGCLAEGKKHSALRGTAARSAVALCLLLSVALLFGSCRSVAVRETETYLDYFNTVCTLTGDAPSKEAFRAVSEEVRTMLERYHRLFDIYREYDGMQNLATLNRMAGRQAVTPDGEVLDLLLYGVEMYRVTDGKLNICMGSVLRLWKEAQEFALQNPDSAILPDADALADAQKHISIESLVIDREAGSAYISDPQTSVDVGAVAKGFAAQRITEWMRSCGYENYCLNLGGNVSAVGGRSDGSAWTVGVRDPMGDGVAVQTEISFGSLVTSGDYERCFYVDGKRYHHIIDPESGYPASYFRSVSVLSQNSATADALSTALFCMPPDRALALAESLDGCEAFFILADGSTLRTSGFCA